MTKSHLSSLALAALSAGAAFLVEPRQCLGESASGKAAERKFLYVAEPGIRDYLEYGGHGVLVFDMDQGHRFLKRIPAAGLNEKGKPLNVKGVWAGGASGR